ncbi:MAG: metal-dependent hydrolase [Pseudomonadota bacterium]
MIVGHLAAGYLAARGLAAIGAGALFGGMLIGSVLPDIDMLWFALVDQGRVHHHDYLTHRPVVWAGLLCVGLALRRASVIGVALGALLHLALDSIAGKIAWAWPISDAATPLVIVPATQAHWLLSFIFHWTFALELALCALALALFVRTRHRFGA